MRVARRSANAAIHDSLESHLWIVLHDRAPDVQVEQRRDVCTVYAFKAIGYPLVQSRDERISEIAVVALLAARRLDRRHVEEQKVVVVGVAQRESRSAKRGFGEDSRELASRGIENCVELLPPVDLFDLGVPIEVQIQNDERATVLDGVAETVDR